MTPTEERGAGRAASRPARLLPPERWPPTRPDSWRPFDAAELRDATRWLARAGLLDGDSYRLLVAVRLEMAQIAREAEATIVRAETQRPGGEGPMGPDFYVARVLRQMPVTYFIRYQLFDVFRGIVADGGVAASTRAALAALRQALDALRMTPSAANVPPAPPVRDGAARPARRRSTR